MISMAFFLCFFRVYCKYHYLEGHEYDNPEEEWLDFLKKMTSDPYWKWSEQYEVETPSNSSDKNEGK